MDENFSLFINTLAEAIDDENVKKLNPNTLLEDIDSWDSFSIMSVIAVFDQNYGIVVSADEVYNVKTLGQLYNLIKIKNE